jgi:hypothetical protein
VVDLWMFLPFQKYLWTSPNYPRDMTGVSLAANHRNLDAAFLVDMEEIIFLPL